MTKLRLVMHQPEAPLRPVDQPTPSMPRLTLLSALLVVTSPAFAQPGPPPDRPGRGPAATAPSVDSQVERLLAFDANKDGSLTKSELTDERLHALFDRADADQNGTATKRELTELLAKETAALAASGRRGGPMGGPGSGPGGPPRDGDRGRGPGEGPPRGDQSDRGNPQPRDVRGQRPRPGLVLPPGVQQRLGLSDDQRRRIDALQEIVDTQLEKILTAEQREMLNDFGPPPGGPGNFDGPPPADGGPQRGNAPRNRQRPDASDRPARPAGEP